MQLNSSFIGRITSLMTIPSSIGRLSQMFGATHSSEISSLKIAQSPFLRLADLNTRGKNCIYLNLQFVRQAHKKAMSSRTHNKDSRGRRLGMKKSDGQINVVIKIC